MRLPLFWNCPIRIHFYWYDQLEKRKSRYKTLKTTIILASCDKLIVQEVRLSDSGNIKCVATNILGRATSVGQLIIEGSNRPKVHTEHFSCLTFNILEAEKCWMISYMHNIFEWQRSDWRYSWNGWADTQSLNIDNKLNIEHYAYQNTYTICLLPALCNICEISTHFFVAIDINLWCGYKGF